MLLVNKPLAYRFLQGGIAKFLTPWSTIQKRNPGFSDIDVLDDDLFPAMDRDDYIKLLENPDRIGFDPETRTWKPPKIKGYDPNLFGYGLDRIYNLEVADYIKQQGRTDDPYLTEEEEKRFRNNSYKYNDEIYSKHVKKKQSSLKEAMAKGLLYHGYGKQLWNNPILNRALMKGSDEEFSLAIYDFYLKNDSARAERHKQYMSTRL